MASNDYSYQKYIKYKIKYLSLKNDLEINKLGGAKKNSKQKKAEPVHVVKYPAASDFLEWLLPNLRKYRIPYKNPNTDGDYSRTFVGSDKEGIMMDWKHFDAYDIDQFNRQINKFGYNVDYDYDNDHGYEYTVKFVKK